MTAMPPWHYRPAERRALRRSGPVVRMILSDFAFSRHYASPFCFCCSTCNNPIVVILQVVIGDVVCRGVPDLIVDLM
jgi:hypothetical protein